MDQELKWGIVGPGKIARAFVQDLARADDRPHRVTAVMSHHLNDAEEFAAKHGIPYFFDSLKAMLSTAPPDIVYIATPHAAHYSQTMECLERGIPVLCEKPLALNLRQAEEMITTARMHGTFLLEGMWIRFLPSLRKVLELLQQGVIGKVNGVVADMSYKAPRDQKNRFYNPALGGGSLLDLGIYPVYLALLILGEPVYLKATASLSAEQIDEGCMIILKYTGGAYALLQSSIVKETEKQARLYGEKGFITIQTPWNEKPAGITVTLYHGESQTYPCTWEGRGFQYEIAEAGRCLSAGKTESDLHNHAISLSLMSLLDDIRAQAHIRYPADER
ncbi:Gfo/Idh/MocA family oxidoreductase [Compostibacter hankyongensis]|uniref:Gfo/Idh/MocA family oxidoreductase n=1 Tax=Compostibacter hankyongensis TaxID=1007089 RepID=A0ABP8FYN0_9BACT